MRTITVFSTETNEKKEINTSATTWGQLKTELQSNGFSVNSMKGMVKETKTTLESDGAVLPTDAFTLFITPTKVKSGIIISRTTSTSKRRIVKKAAAKKKAPVKKALVKKVAAKKTTAKKVVAKRVTKVTKTTKTVARKSK